MKHGQYQTLLYRVHTSMLQRCSNPRDKAYFKYGGRGIYVCDEWRDFLTFKAWADATGYAKGLTLERENNDGPYAPSNCRWATYQEQALNRCNTHRLADGSPACLTAARNGIKWQTFHARLWKGWSVEDACTRPTHPRRPNREKGIKI